MILYINTTKGHKIEITLKKGRVVIARKVFEAKYCQAEKLLLAINKLLAVKKIKLKDLIAIEVINQGGSPASKRKTSFTALRIGVVTANTLGYSLGIPVRGLGKDRVGSKKNLDFNVIKPIYNKEPNITK